VRLTKFISDRVVRDRTTLPLVYLPFLAPSVEPNGFSRQAPRHAGAGGLDRTGEVRRVGWEWQTLLRRRRGGLNTCQTLAGPRCYGDRPGRSDICCQGCLMSLIASVGSRFSGDRRRHEVRRHHEIQVGHAHCRRHGRRCLRGLGHPAPRYPGSG
jgi:hypothetical protein